MNIKVQRIKDNGNQTTGTMSAGEFSCATLELPWKDNNRGISCIPKGLYNWIKVVATAAIPYPHILILSVANRDGVCIHRANYVRQLKGCIAVGEKHIDIDGNGELDVTNSTKTFESLMAILPENGTIEIL